MRIQMQQIVAESQGAKIITLLHLFFCIWKGSAQLPTHYFEGTLTHVLLDSCSSTPYLMLAL